ncbi:hypothetical protein Back11_21940 [Paenibacillus baekrokdamisoli]|uniref:Uncharacterized protein n=1 Tax=Paenibacillus baekrokdamisoli TaxID=1712516 RepID=A0A3G9JD13_9BACL|nr:hypothetical protein [Paenibacillus baekrokdamisoli]MBB3069797.1 hypothetical protein [Paenibacillus baekrokdamisoli]BBH20849.1 hypothetical protein Back11_21940 [Paenibacillus baekrokdamisoli]
MIGTWRWNVTLGICGVVLTLLFSLGSNGLEVTATRCVYAFIVFFLLAYLFRAAVAIILQPTPPSFVTAIDESTENIKGNSVDLSTPDQSDELNDLLKMPLDGSTKLVKSETSAFQPLTPPKLVSTQNKEPEELAKALRHLTGG